MPRAVKSLKSKTKPSKPHLVLYLLVFALVGGAILLLTHAAPNPNLPGDLDNSGKVDATDLSILLSAFASTNSTTIATADINNDSKVDVSDLSILLSHYGQTYSG